MPVMCSRSPGLVESTRSASRMTSTERGSWPGGARSGISCGEKGGGGGGGRCGAAEGGEGRAGARLQVHRLAVHVLAESVLGLEQVAVRVLCRVGGASRGAGEGGEVAVLLGGELLGGGAPVLRHDHLGPHERALGHDPLHAHQRVKQRRACRTPALPLSARAERTARGQSDPGSAQAWRLALRELSHAIRFDRRAGVLSPRGET